MQSRCTSVRDAVKARAYRRGFSHGVNKLADALSCAGALKGSRRRVIDEWRQAVEAWAADTNVGNADDPPPWLKLRG